MFVQIESAHVKKYRRKERGRDNEKRRERDTQKTTNTSQLVYFSVFRGSLMKRIHSWHKKQINHVININNYNGICKIDCMNGISEPRSPARWYDWTSSSRRLLHSWKTTFVFMKINFHFRPELCARKWWDFTRNSHRDSILSGNIPSVNQISFVASSHTTQQCD